MHWNSNGTVRSGWWQAYACHHRQALRRMHADLGGLGGGGEGGEGGEGGLHVWGHRSDQGFN